VIDTPEGPGELVRAARSRRRFTLRQLSDATGLSESFLSQFERGLTQASISSLRSITTALGITLGDLFETGGPGGVRVLRESARPVLPFGDNARKFLLTPKPLDNIEVFSVVLEVGGSTGAEQYTHGDSEELLLVQFGSVKVELAADVFLLEAGDSIVFRSNVPHRVVNISPEHSSVLWIISPPSH
jgi:transcriptional regulator with XRE-family HTH domain